MRHWLLLMLAAQAASQLRPPYCQSGARQLSGGNPGGLSLQGSERRGTTFHPPCPGHVGLDDRTTTVLALVYSGMNYTLYQNWSACDGWATDLMHVGQVWIDFNFNQEFEPSESIGSWRGYPPASSEFTFRVRPGRPTHAQTRMRIMMKETDEYPPLLPCQNFTFGGVFDISIILAGSGAYIPWTKAYGPGFERVQRVGTTSFFTMQTFDPTGKLMNRGGVLWMASLVGPDGLMTVPVDWVDTDTGAYPVKFTVHVPGYWLLTITADGDQYIPGSPLSILFQ